jgi:hypothetical protein
MLTKLKEERDKKRLSVNLLHTDPSSPRTNLPFSEVAALIVKDDSCPNNPASSDDNFSGNRTVRQRLF